MRISLPNKRLVWCGLKIAGGIVAAYLTLAAANPACPPNVFCTLDFGFQPSLRMWAVGAALAAIALLLSAFKDLMSIYRQTDLAGRNIEAITNRQNDDLDFRLGDPDG